MTEFRIQVPPFFVNQDHPVLQFTVANVLYYIALLIFFMSNE